MTSKNGIEYIPNNSTCGKLLQPLTNVKPNGELAWTYELIPSLEIIENLLKIRFLQLLSDLLS